MVFIGYSRCLLEKLLRQCRRKTPQETIECIVDALSAFAAGRPQRDDITLVVMRVESRATSLAPVAV